MPLLFPQRPPHPATRSSLPGGRCWIHDRQALPPSIRRAVKFSWSEYRRHETRLAGRGCWRCSSTSATRSPTSRSATSAVFATDRAPGPLARAARREVRAGSQRRHDGGRCSCTPTPAASSSLAARTRRSSCYKENEQTGDKRAIASMNDKCASGTGATDRQVPDQGRHAARRGHAAAVRSDAKLHHVAAKCGVFAETDIVNLVKSGIPSNEIMCSLADAIVVAEPRRCSRAATRCKSEGAAARRAEHVPAVPPGVLAPADPGDLGRRAASSVRRTCRSRS